MLLISGLDSRTLLVEGASDDPPCWRIGEYALVESISSSRTGVVDLYVKTLRFVFHSISKPAGFTN